MVLSVPVLLSVLFQKPPKPRSPNPEVNKAWATSTPEVEGTQQHCCDEKVLVTTLVLETPALASLPPFHHTLASLPEALLPKYSQAQMLLHQLLPQIWA